MNVFERWKCRHGFHDFSKYVPPEHRERLPNGRLKLTKWSLVCARCDAKEPPP